MGNQSSTQGAPAAAAAANPQQASSSAATTRAVSAPAAGGDASTQSAVSTQAQAQPPSAAGGVATDTSAATPAAAAAAPAVAVGPSASLPPTTPSTTTASFTTSTNMNYPASTFPMGEKFYGYENPSNTCYVNSVLQALYACHSFRIHVLHYYEEIKLKRKETDTLLTALAFLFYRIQASKKSRGTISPATFIKKLKKSNAQFDSLAHQDAQEFLIFLLNECSDSIKADRVQRAKDVMLAAQAHAMAQTQVQHIQSFSSLPMSGHGNANHNQASSSTVTSPVPTPRKSLSFNSLFSSSTPSLLSPAASHAKTANVSDAPVIYDDDGNEIVLQNMSAISAATAKGTVSANQTSIQNITSSISDQLSTATTASLPSVSSQPSSTATSTNSSLASTASSIQSPPPSQSQSQSLPSTSEPSWIQSLFEGTLTNVTECIRCGNIATRDESFLDLSLDIEAQSSLTWCLQSFSQPELLNSRDKYLCDYCNCRQEAMKSMRIKFTPEIAILHLKRFKYLESTGNFTKLTHRVGFPMTIKFSTDTNTVSGSSSGDGDGKYELTAIVVHIGNGARSGHYVCMARGGNGQFYLYDDTAIVPVTESQIRETFGAEFGGSHQDGYILFYSRQASPGHKFVTQCVHTPETNTAAAASAAPAPSVSGQPTPAHEAEKITVSSEPESTAPAAAAASAVTALTTVNNASEAILTAPASVPVLVAASTDTQSETTTASRTSSEDISQASIENSTARQTAAGTDGELEAETERATEGLERLNDLPTSATLA